MPEILWLSILASSFFTGILIRGRVSVILIPAALTALVLAEKGFCIKNQVFLFFLIAILIVFSDKLIKKLFDKFTK